MGTWYVAGIPYSSNELYHHGILGQKWGVRRFQNSDGTLTTAGKERYGKTPNTSKDDTDFSHIKDRKKKAQQELKILSVNDITDNYEDHSKRDWDRMEKLRSGKISEAFKSEKGKAALKKISDFEDAEWYNDAKKAQREKELKKYPEVIRNIVRDQQWNSFMEKRDNIERELYGVILKEIGYKDTPEAREAMLRWQLLR